VSKGSGTLSVVDQDKQVLSNRTVLFCFVSYKGIKAADINYAKFPVPPVDQCHGARNRPDQELRVEILNRCFLAPEQQVLFHRTQTIKHKSSETLLAPIHNNISQ
jgi:hypothetical protein